MMHDACCSCFLCLSCEELIEVHVCSNGLFHQPGQFHHSGGATILEKPIQMQQEAARDRLIALVVEFMLM